MDDSLRACEECGAVARVICLQCSLLKHGDGLACYCAPCSAAVHKMSVVRHHTPLTMKQAKEIHENVKALKLPDAVARLCRELDGYPAEGEGSAAMEYRKFLAVKALFGDYRPPLQLRPLTPEIEEVWRCHAEDAAAYQAACEQLSGQVLPFDAAALDDVSHERFYWQRALTKQSYALLFAAPVKPMPARRVHRGDTFVEKKVPKVASKKLKTAKISPMVEVAPAPLDLDTDSDVSPELSPALAGVESSFGRKVPSVLLPPRGLESSVSSVVSTSSRNNAAWELANAAPTEPSPESPERFHEGEEEDQQAEEVFDRASSFSSFFSSGRKRSEEGASSSGAASVKRTRQGYPVPVYFVSKQGNTVTSVDLSKSVGELKAQLHEEGYAAPAALQLFRGGRRLEDAMTLRDAKITKGCYVNIIEAAGKTKG